MKIHVEKNATEVAIFTAREVSKTIRRINQTRQAVLGLATGSTPVPLYNELVLMENRGHLSFKKTTTFNLDEYIGLAEGHPESYRYFMEQHLFGRLKFGRPEINIPNPHKPDLFDECDSYEQRIKAVPGGKIDLQILGIGGNGHIGFNEPKSPLNSRTRIVTLSQKTRDDNSHEGFETPPYAISMGIATIMEARSILLLVTGEKKAAILNQLWQGRMGYASDIPSMILKLHPNVTIIADEAAAHYMKAAQKRGNVEGAFNIAGSSR